MPLASCRGCCASSATSRPSWPPAPRGGCWPRRRPGTRTGQLPTSPGRTANSPPTPAYCSTGSGLERDKADGARPLQRPGVEPTLALLVFLRGVPLPYPFDGVREELLLGITDTVAGPAAEQVLVLVALLL